MRRSEDAGRRDPDRGAGDPRAVPCPDARDRRRRRRALRRDRRRRPERRRSPAASGQNSDGDRQMALDVIADEAFRTALAGTGVRWYASEELEDVAGLDPDGDLAVAIDPLDGSSNIDVNVVGRHDLRLLPGRATAGPASFLRPGSDLVAAGYVIYGPQTALVLSFGERRRTRSCSTGRRAPSASSATGCPIPARSCGVRDQRLELPPLGPADPRLRRRLPRRAPPGRATRDFNMRWIASLVAEVHRILARGGIFLYPRRRAARLRARPAAPGLRMRTRSPSSIEQAGGKATDGCDRLLDQRAAEPARAHALRLRLRRARSTASPPTTTCADAERSALFGKRGLFRS